MVDSMKMHLESMGPISKADINISKITVVGGNNSTGKSTLSKVLYSFLRANSYNRQEIAYESIIKLIRNEYRYISRFIGERESSRIRFPPMRLRDPEDFDRVLEAYYQMKEMIEEFDIFDVCSNRIKVIDNLIRVIEDNSFELYVSLMRTLLESEFLSDSFGCYIDIDNNIIDFKNHDFHDDEAFKSSNNIIINDVFYIDSVSVLDTFEISKYDTESADHFHYLKRNLVSRSKDVFDEKINQNTIKLEKEIENIINGKFVFERGEFKFISNENFSSDMQNTASGTKQIGLIQLLMANRKLNENSFLIIDEPEVNLHPDWQFKLAKILVLISLKLNISIYINSHSPLFIEALHTYADYYDILDEITYHLGEMEDKSVIISEIEESHLSKIYDNLGQPYFDMDILRLEKDLD